MLSNELTQNTNLNINFLKKYDIIFSDSEESLLYHLKNNELKILHSNLNYNSLDFFVFNLDDIVNVFSRTIDSSESTKENIIYNYNITFISKNIETLAITLVNKTNSHIALMKIFEILDKKTNKNI
jgi:hypothetical protein